MPRRLLVPGVLNTLYAAAVRRRRERYAARPDLRRRLRRPVISVGNLAVGGRGKTPLTAHLARLLLGAGEWPAILSRGYGRASRDGDVVVVRDRQGIRADLARAGDEPLMLARQLPGVVVVVSPDRYLAGQRAEQDLGVTVHVLDDGFQHLQLERDIDLLILGRDDIADPVTLPGGHLREPLDTIIAADAVLTADDDVVVDMPGLDVPVFRLRRSGVPRAVTTEPVLAVAGIASPERFFDDLREAGWPVAERMVFEDHHRYTRKDVDRMAAVTRGAGAVRVVTTEKDYVRLLPYRPFPLPVEPLPAAVQPEPAAEFAQWLLGEIATVRGDA